MQIELARMVADVLASSTYGVNKQLLSLPRAAGDPRPPEVRFIADEMRWALPVPPPKMPALYVTAEEMFEAHTFVQTQRPLDALSVPIMVKYLHADADTPNAIRDALYTMRAAQRSIVAWLRATTFREENAVQVISLPRLQYGLWREDLGGSIVSAALIARFQMRDNFPLVPAIPYVIASFSQPDNGSDLGITDSRHTWEYINGVWGTQGEMAYLVSHVPDAGGSLAVIESHRAVGRVGVQLPVIAASAALGSSGFLVFRYQDPDNYYIWGGNQSGAPVALVRRTNGTFNTLSATSPGLRSGSRLDVEIFSDGTFYCYADGAIRTERHGETQGVGATKHGIFQSTSPLITRFKHFSVTD